MLPSWGFGLAFMTGKTPILAGLMMLALFAAGCSKNVPAGPKASTEDCDKFLPATSQTRKIPHPKFPSACYAVVMMCNYCQYDAQGAFEKAGSEACGVCIGADF